MTYEEAIRECEQEFYDWYIAADQCDPQFLFYLGERWGMIRTLYALYSDAVPDIAQVAIDLERGSDLGA